jgi:hypothetical protein
MLKQIAQREATMSELLTKRYEDNLLGGLSCFDRIVITGTDIACTDLVPVSLAILL